MEIIYCGMNDIIKAIAKENGYSMNKARKEFANMIRFIRGNQNKRLYYNLYIIPQLLLDLQEHQ